MYMYMYMYVLCVYAGMLRNTLYMYNKSEVKTSKSQPGYYTTESLYIHVLGLPLYWIMELPYKT